VLCKSQKIEKNLAHTQYFGFYEVTNRAYFNVESVYLEKLRKSNKSIPITQNQVFLIAFSARFVAMAVMRARKIGVALFLDTDSILGDSICSFECWYEIFKYPLFKYPNKWNMTSSWRTRSCNRK
jgi:hypothetical protein